jgi:hypothetical protein
MKKFIDSILLKIDDWRRARYVRRVRKNWEQVEKYLAKLPNWQKKQIRRDIIKGNKSFFDL